MWVHGGSSRPISTLLPAKRPEDPMDPHFGSPSAQRGSKRPRIDEVGSQLAGLSLDVVSGSMSSEFSAGESADWTGRDADMADVEVDSDRRLAKTRFKGSREMRSGVSCTAIVPLPAEPRYKVPVAAVVAASKAPPLRAPGKEPDIDKLFCLPQSMLGRARRNDGEWVERVVSPGGADPNMAIVVYDEARPHSLTTAVGEVDPGASSSWELPRPAADTADTAAAHSWGVVPDDPGSDVEMGDDL